MKRIGIFLLTILLSTTLFAQSRGLLTLKSFVVPGWSQISSERNYGYAMLTAEAVIIGSIYYFHSESKVLEQECYEYAIKFAHLHPNGYNDDFFKHLARYESSGFDAGGYNNWVRQTAIDLYPDNPEMQQQYINDNAYGNDKYWYWDSSNHRSEYNKIRNRSMDYDNYALVAGGIIILNHLVSTIDVLRWTAPGNKANLSFNLQDKTPILQLNYHW
ncbi:MAG TPA: hypothetical protein PKU76_04055 [Candidatus Cloacimonas sp.]|nr:hypothetical protein [Candidatus Cloacimonas sp.]